MPIRRLEQTGSKIGSNKNIILQIIRIMKVQSARMGCCIFMIFYVT